MKIFITGANGFIGQHLVNFLSQYDYELFPLIRAESLPRFNLKKNIHVLYGDLTDKKSLEILIPPHSVIINLAANPYHPKLSYQVNVEGVKNLLDVGTKKEVKKIIQMSSQATKITHMGVYGKTKKMADEMIMNSTLNYVILKPSLVYGEGEKGLFAKTRSLIERNRYIPIFGSGNIKINPIHINDLLQLMKLVIDDNSNHKITYEPGSAKFITYNDFFKKLAALSNKKISLIHISLFIGITGAKLLSLVLKNPPFYIDNVLGSTQSTNPQPHDILKFYNYKPLDIDQGLKSLYPNQKINIAVVGLGKMGILHATILNTLDNTQLTALIDPNKSIHKTIKSMGIKTNIYLSLSDALKSEKIDAVYITTPTFTHFELIKLTLKHKKHVFIEKPVTLNQQEIDWLKKNRSNQIIHTGYTLLFKRTFNEVKRIIDTKQYGNVMSFKANFEHSEVNSKKTGWMFIKNKSGGGVLMNPGPHVFSIINLFFGNPKKISSRITSIFSTDVEDQADLRFEYKGYSGDLFLTWSAKDRPLPYLGIDIQFEKANIFVTGEAITIKNSKSITHILERDLPPLISPVFNINPEANGESYYIEDKLFIDAILENNPANFRNCLSNALNIEAIIQRCYKVSN